jgi:hypothetical protein
LAENQQKAAAAKYTGTAFAPFFLLSRSSRFKNKMQISPFATIVICTREVKQAPVIKEN